MRGHPYSALFTLRVLKLLNERTQNQRALDCHTCNYKGSAFRAHGLRAVRTRVLPSMKHQGPYSKLSREGDTTLVEVQN